MAVLMLPSAAVQGSFLEAMAEFAAEGRGRPEDDSMLGNEIRLWSGRWETTEGFASYTGRFREQSAGIGLPSAWIPSTTWWWVEADQYLGRITLRHRLNERLLRNGGHIGYDVRPGARRRGHATAMLAAVLPHAAAMGIDRALLTCDRDNVASRGVIEANGGVLEDELDGVLRFWVPTATSPPAAPAAPGPAGSPPRER